MKIVWVKTRRGIFIKREDIALYLLEMKKNPEIDTKTTDMFIKEFLEVGPDY